METVENTSFHPSGCYGVADSHANSMEANLLSVNFY